MNTWVSSHGELTDMKLDNIEVGEVEPIPEPSTILLLTTGLAGVGGYSRIRRKRRKK